LFENKLTTLKEKCKHHYDKQCNQPRAMFN
jgi:hypothetical protein